MTSSRSCDAESCVTYLHMDPLIQPMRILHTRMTDDKEMCDMFRNDRFSNVWFKLVGHYTQRELSFWEDRPHAVRGVINFLFRLWDDDCNFGVWASHPVESLIWKVSGARSSRRLAGLPTWSWMPVSGEADLNNVLLISGQLATVGWELTAKQDCGRICIECHVVGGKELLESKKLLKAWDDVFSDPEENEGEDLSKYRQLWFMFLATTGEYTLAMIRGLRKPSTDWRN